MPTDVDTVEGLVRIRIRLERGAGEAGPEEDAVWGEPLGSDRFRIESCPFFAYGISRDDVVRAAGPDEGGPVLDDVLEKGGHRTLRFALEPSVDFNSTVVQRLLDRVSEAGCTYELLRPRYAAIDIPPEVDLAGLADLLQEASRRGTLVWEWADPRPS
jgi:hypothetical protein